MGDARIDYLVKVLSRTKRKDYDNYVVNAVWQRLADPELKPETQRYMKLAQGYALIDLYFPAVNVGIECDEAHHLAEWNKLSDAQRTKLLSDRLVDVSGSGTYEEIRIPAYGTYDEIERGIDEAVRIIKKRKAELKPKPWNPYVIPWEEARSKGFIHIDDGYEFRRISDILLCFGIHKKIYGGGFFKIGKEPYRLWCPQLAMESDDGLPKPATFGILNVLSEDKRTLYETKPDGSFVADSLLRLTFAKGTDELGRKAYRFVGVFSNKGRFNQEENRNVHIRIDDIIDLASWM